MTTSYDSVLVVFTRPEADLAKFDVALGPCVPLPGHRRALLGATLQHPGRIQAYEQLFSLLEPISSEGPWANVASSGQGTLVRFSEGFASALADLSRDLVSRAMDRPKDVAWALESHDDVAQRWLDSTDWPPGMTLGGVGTQLGRLTGPARIAQDRGQRLYCWAGPGFNPYVLAAGTAASLPGYLAQKRQHRI